jgi:hypothetical protein
MGLAYALPIPLAYALPFGRQSCPTTSPERLMLLRASERERHTTAGSMIEAKLLRMLLLRFKIATKP